MNIDERYMRRAMRLARRGQGLTSPNPAVGAVIVKGGRVIATGYHKRCGLPHAEVNALRRAGKAAKGATLYVTMEPCNHFGRTPPCTDAIVESGIRRVVIAAPDPNPVTDGGGIRALKRRGVKVTVGIMKEEARLINRPFEKHIKTKMPYVTLKIAESLDGKIATKTGDSRWITDTDSRVYVHKLRSRADAVMVGVNTVIKDDPLLLPGAAGLKLPCRIVVDSSLKTPPGARIFSRVKESPVILAASRKASAGRIAKFRKIGAHVIVVRLKEDRIDLKELLRRLGDMGITDILAEGGSELGASLIEERLVDRLLFFIAPKIIGGRAAVPSIGGRGAAGMKSAVSLRDIRLKRFSKDILIDARVA